MRYQIEYLRTVARVASRKACLRDVMIPDVWTVSFDAPLEDVVRLMERHHIKRVPVVEGGKIVGIVCKRAITSDQDEPSAKSPCTSTTLRAFSAVAFTAAPRAEINETAAAVSSVVEKVRLFIIMNPFKAKWFGVRGPQAPPIRTPEDMVANLSTKWDAERKPRLLRHRTPRGTMPQITVHVVFDTNSIYARVAADRLLSTPASELIRKFSGNTSPKVCWHLPPMVKSEREYQMIEEALRLLPVARKAARFMERPLVEFTQDQARMRVHHIIKQQIEEHGIEEMNFDLNLVDWSTLIDRAVKRHPPFDPNSESEKGFRDAIILETFLQLHKKLNLSAPDQLVLLSGDGLVQIAVERALGNIPTVLLIDSRAKLETHLVALSQQINQSFAQQIVLVAHNFLLKNFVNGGELRRLLGARFKPELGSRPPEGGFICMYRVVPGETALLGKQDVRWKFETTILVEVEVARSIFGIPLFPTKQFEESFRTSSTRDPGIGKGSASITNIPPAISNSTVDLAYSVGDRVVKSFGRHTIRLVWSAKLSDDRELSEFQVENIEYEGVVWE
jgi:CBS domain/PIN domain